MEISDGIAIAGYKSLQWIFESSEPKNDQKTLAELRTNYLEKIGLPTLVTPGLLLMAAYLQLVYVREAKLVTDFGSIDISKFKIVTGVIKDNKDLIRRLRNAISHARVDIFEDNILFVDGRNNEKEVVIQIAMSDFGQMLNRLVELHMHGITKK